MKRTVAILISLIALAARAQSVDKLVAQGDALDAQLKSEDALKIYLQAEPLAKNDPSLLIKIGKQYGESMTSITNETAKRAAGEKALAYAQRALNLSPGMADAHLAVAICYGRLLDLVPVRTRVEYSRLVKQETEQALKLDPKSDYAWHMLGRWNKAVATMGGFYKGIVTIVYGGLPDASLEKARECFEKADALHPGRVSNVIELGITLAASGKKEEARKLIEQGLALPSRERDDPQTKIRGRTALAE